MTAISLLWRLVSASCGSTIRRDIWVPWGRVGDRDFEYASNMISFKNKLNSQRAQILFIHISYSKEFNAFSNSDTIDIFIESYRCNPCMTRCLVHNDL